MSGAVRIGDFLIDSLLDGYFGLDGGAMFGVVPKVLWEKTNPADELNRIILALRPALVNTGKELVLVNTGIGDKFNEKFQKIYRIDKSQSLEKSLENLKISEEDINYVILTHLHFDHCGGNTRFDRNGKLVPKFPRAKYFIQRKEWERATNPDQRSKASYLEENFLVLKESNQLELIDGETEILPGIRAIPTGGHTSGHQVVLIKSGAIYWSDLIPTVSHLNLPYIMGYDLFPLETMEKKEVLLNRALAENWLSLFEHDPKIGMGYLKRVNDKIVCEPI